MLRSIGWFLSGVLLMGCAHGAAPTKATSAHVEGSPGAELPWASFSPETFARAKRENKFIVMDGSAEWCHWCHVMEATTYHDPSVRAVLDKSFIAIKVDVDSRPDLAERYGDYGWPATIIFGPDATELGKYRGYIAPEKFTEILREVVSSATPVAVDTIGVSRPAPKTPLAKEHLAWIQHATEIELADYYDDDEGGWGRKQKAPLGWNNLWLLSRSDADSRQKALFTLDKQSKLIDPVWGGIYQYSAASDWDHAHFEKLMTFQAPALESYAVAYKLTRDPKQLGRARLMVSYLDRFMKAPEGGFYTTQDADVNAHDRTKPFMDGHAYYALNDKDRLARGLPRIDKNEYGRENGLAIAAYVTMFEATQDASVLASAERAAARVLATHLTKRGGISHGVITEEPKQLYLADNAAFGFALMRLHEATHKEEYKNAAQSIATFMATELHDEEGGGFFGATKDPDAVGVFAKRRVPFEDNVMAVRFLTRLKDPHVDRVLRAISVPEEIKARGRMLGDYLLALDEATH